MQICQNKIKTKCIFISLEVSDESHDDVDVTPKSKICRCRNADCQTFEYETALPYFFPFQVTYDKVESDLMIFLVEECDGITKLTSVILGGLTVFLVMVIIGLLVKIRKLKTGTFSKLLCLSYNWFCCYWTFS